MTTTKGHPHAELMKMYAEDAAETDKPWERWEMLDADGCRKPLIAHPIWFEKTQYRRKPTEHALLQGHTMAQWEFMREQGFDCEFSVTEDFHDPYLSKLIAIQEEAHEPFTDSSGITWPYCRPRRAKGVKQPWFGGECPVDPTAKVVCYFLNGDSDTAAAKYFDWKHAYKASDTIAFIEL